MAQKQLFADDYKVTLDVFEGPLDLLLYLVRREEIDIYDIPIGRIAAQYMEFLDEARDMNLDVAGEFVAMAATLMVIKSRMLLPVERRNATEGGPDEWVDPRLDIVRQLVEYKKFKDAAAHLETLELLQSSSYGFGGGRPKFEKTPADMRAALAKLTLEDLFTAFRVAMARAAEVPPGELKGARFSVSDRMDFVMSKTREEGRVAFFSLFTPESPRGEVITTFLAILELLRQHRILVFQNAAFHEITILPSGETDADAPLERPDDYE